MDNIRELIKLLISGAGNEVERQNALRKIVLYFPTDEEYREMLSIIGEYSHGNK